MLLKVFEKMKAKKYNFIVSTKAKDYTFVYRYTGSELDIVLGTVERSKIDAIWFDSRNAVSTSIGDYCTSSSEHFDQSKVGNGWLIAMKTTD